MPKYRLSVMKGASKVVALLDAGLPLEQIVDSVGRHVHPDAEEFFSSYSEMKRGMIAKAVDNLDIRVILRDLEDRHDRVRRLYPCVNTGYTF